MLNERGKEVFVLMQDLECSGKEGPNAASTELKPQTVDGIMSVGDPCRQGLLKDLLFAV